MRFRLDDDTDIAALQYFIRANRERLTGLVAEIRPARRKGDEQKEEECSTSTASS